MNRNWKRWGALLMALVMALSLFPVSALAARRDDDAVPAIPAGEEEWAETPDLPVNAQAPENVPIVPVVEEAQATLAAVTEGAIEATNSSRDIPVENYTLDVDSSITDGSSGPKEKATDGNEGTWWHSNSTTPTGGHWISVELPEAKWVSAFRYKPRADYTKANANATDTVNGNGYVTSYQIMVSQNGTDWTEAATGSWSAFETVSGRGSLPTGAWEVANFTPVKAKYVKLVGVTTGGNGNANNAHMHAAEIRVVKAESITASGTVTGTVTDGNGQPLEGATVTLAQDNAACTPVSGVTAATTDASGNYSLSWSLTNAEERNYRVRASLAGYGAALSDAVNFTGGGAKTANVTLTAITADESYDMTAKIPAHVDGNNASVSAESNGLKMTFGSSNRLNNLVRFTNITGTNTEVEFDATRSGDGAGGFGVALRHQTGIYIYAGQNTAGSGWCNESVNSGTPIQSAVVQGPSFASGETRHFKVRLQQSGGVAHVSLWIDGVVVMEEVPAGSDVTDLGALAFICGVPGTTVTVSNLYVTSHDEGYTITMPDTLKGYEVVGATEVKALVAAAEGTGTFKANPGDIINIYSATPLSKTMTAPLTVYKAADNSVSSVENILHITHNHSENKDLGYYVQFPMPDYNVTLTPSALEEVETKELKNVSILRASSDPEVVNVGGTVTLRATLTPAIGVEELGVIWSSDNTAVATVDGAPRAELGEGGADAAYATATVTGVSAGTATITITTANGLTDTRQVTVGVAVEDVTLPTAAVTLYTNGKTAEQQSTATLTATVTPASATNKNLTWWSDNTDVATVDENGVVTAVASGTTKIYVRSKQNTSAEAYQTVEVVTLPTGLTLDVTAAELTTDTGAANNTQVVAPTLLPADASNKTIAWSTGNGDIAAVTKPWSNQNALITAVGVGTTTVTARSAADNTVTATVTVTVKATVTGDVSVSGKPAYNSVLTAETGAVIEGAKDGLTYQWYRLIENEDGETTEVAIAGATADAYTPVKDDIGHVLAVKITPKANGYYTGFLTATTAEITKEAGHEVDERNLTYVNCTTETSADGAIQGLLAGHIYQYQKQNDDGETWPEEWENVEEGDAITGLTPGNYRIRHVGDETREPGEPSNTITIVVTGGAEKKLTIPHDFVGGDVRADRSQIPVGNLVTLTVEPDEGYELDTLTATYTDGDGEHTLTPDEGDDGKYTFHMPNGDVTVAATFKLKTYHIGHALTNITCSMGAAEDHTAQHGEAFSITLTPAAGYNMPSTLMVTTANGQRFTAYTYTVDSTDPAKRVLTFARGVTEDVTVTAEATLKTYPVEYDGANVTFAAAPARVGWHQILAVAVTADAGYELPETVTVTMNGAAVDYTYTKDTGAVYIAENVIEGSLSIVVNGEKSLVPLDKVSISGVARVGERLTTTITPAEADGHVAYQWYWVEGEGESATWTLIPDADGRSRVVTEQSIDKFVGVKVKALDGQGFSGEVSSQTTGTVIDTTGEELLPTQVQIVRERVSVEVGASETLTAYVGPSTATNKTVSWSTSDDSVVTVENGVITGVAPGRATITVTSVADETVKDTCVVTVTEPPVIEAEAKDILVPYDGLPHGIAVAVTKPAGGGARVQYSRNGSTFSSSNPTFSAVGEYVVWYKVTASDLPDLVGQAKVTIEKAKPAVKLTADPTSLSGEGEITLTVTLPDYVNAAGLSLTVSDQTLPVTKNEDGTYTVSLPGGTKTYTFTASLLGTDDYESVTATCTVKVGVSSSTTRPTTTTTTKPDGTKVTTETKPDGTKVETVEEPDGTKAVTETKPDGSKTATVEEPDGTKAVTETKPDGSKTATVEQADGTKSETVVTAEGEATITVTDPDGEELVKTEIPATIPEPETKFEDLDKAPWAEEAINKVAGLELVKGIGGNKYDPVTPMTRGALATVLHRLSNGKTDYEVAFKDVAQGRYYTEGVAWAAKANVVKGVSQDIFAPDQIITREQLAVMLARYAKLIGMSTKADTKSLGQFTDGDTTGAWAVDGMAWCVEKGILKGKGQNNLDPTAEVSRAEVAVMLDRFIALIQK